MNARPLNDSSRMPARQKETKPHLWLSRWIQSPRRTIVENLPSVEPVLESISIEQGREFEIEHTSLRLELARPVFSWFNTISVNPFDFLFPRCKLILSPGFQLIDLKLPSKWTENCRWLDLIKTWVFHRSMGNWESHLKKSYSPIFHFIFCEVVWSSNGSL